MSVKRGPALTRAFANLVLTHAIQHACFGDNSLPSHQAEHILKLARAIVVFEKDDADYAAYCVRMLRDYTRGGSDRGIA